MVSLSKGQGLKLEKSMNLCLVGLGWDPNEDGDLYEDVDFDLDLSVFMLDSTGRVRSEKDFVFFGNQVHASGSVRSFGDDRTGENSEEGDDEKVLIDFSKIPSYVDWLAITVSIYDEEETGLTFSDLTNAYVRVVKVRKPTDEDGEEVVRYDLDFEFEEENAMVACEIVRNGSEWKFVAVGAGYDCGLEGLCEKYGVDVG